MSQGSAGARPAQKAHRTYPCHCARSTPQASRYRARVNQCKFISHAEHSWLPACGCVDASERHVESHRTCRLSRVVPPPRAEAPARNWEGMHRAGALLEPSRSANCIEAGASTSGSQAGASAGRHQRAIGTDLRKPGNLNCQADHIATPAPCHPTTRAPTSNANAPANLQNHV